MKFAPALTVVFIALKLTNYIEWSWWLVLAPIPVSMVALFFTLLLIELSKQARDKRGIKRYDDN